MLRSLADAARRRRRWVAALIFCAVLTAAKPASAVIFYFANDDGAGEGFNDPALGAARQNAVQYALNIWGNLLAPSYVGETIVVHATFDPLGGDLFGATGAQAYAPYVATDFSQIYVGPVADHLVPDGSFAAASIINAQFNSDVDNDTVLGTSNWYYGTDGHPGTNIDLVTVALHEIMHGLGFTSQFDYSTGNYAPIDFGPGNGVLNLPSLYDGYINIGNGSIVPFTGLTDAERIAAATSNNLYWAGANGIAANGGVLPQLYAPGTFQQGSSITHLDETAFSTDLISPVLGIGEVHHLPSAVDLGMLQDLGWDIAAVPEPSSLTIAGVLIAATAYLRRRTRAIRDKATQRTVMEKTGCLVLGTQY